MRVKGLINLHLQDCANDDCVCGNLEELYDYSNDRYLPSSVQASGDLHRNQVFVNHFNKQLYSEALNKFINSPSIHISYAFYQFQVLRNVHAALHELKIAGKKRPTIQQRFTIFRYQELIEAFVIKDSLKTRHVYEQLTNVKEFERLFQEMQKQIEKVCNLQVEFWTHLATVIPDLNYLNDLNLKIFNSSQEADRYWNLLCEINPHYPQALTMYGEYLTYIRNNQQSGKEFFDKAHIAVVGFAAQKSIAEHVKRSDILFTEDATVIHISGNKESSGRILKTSQGLKKCFGWDKQEVIGHNVNFLMPTLFAEKHNDFLDQYYKTGRQNIFNKERQLFAQNKTGYCFTMKILIKTMPNLSEGVQYVGMVRPIMTDYEYMITDMQGNIDTFTSGVGSALSLNPQIFKDNSTVNIQVLAPELMCLFEYKRTPMMVPGSASATETHQHNRYGRRSSFNTFQFGTTKFMSNNKFSVPGGDALKFFIPQNFMQIIKSDKTTSKSSRQKKKKGEEMGPPGAIQTNNVNKQSAQFKEFMKFIAKGRSYGKRAPDLKKLLACKEYKESELQKTMTVEIREWAIPMGNNEDKGLKMLLFMIPKNQQNDKKQQELQSFDQPVPNRQVNQEVQEEPRGRPQINRGQTQNMTRNDQKILGKGAALHSFQSQVHDPQLQGAISFLDIDPSHHQEPLTPIKEVDSNHPDASSLKKGIQKSAQPPQSQVPLQKIDLPPKIQLFSEKKEINLVPQTPGRLDMDLNFERQDTDENEEDNEDQLSTDRIDVKKDIALNDDIKQGTKSFEDNYSQMRGSGSKMSLPGMGKMDSTSALLNKVASNKFDGKEGFSPPAKVHQELPSMKSQSEEKKNQQNSKPLMEYISQSKDDPLDEGAESDMDEGEGDEGYDDDEFGGEDDDGQDEEGEGGSHDEGISEQRSQGSDDELMNEQMQQQKRRKGKGRGRDSQNLQQEWVLDQKSINLERQQTNQLSNQAPEKKQKIHDYTRIVTNPRYKYFDEETCGSAYFNDCNASDKELEIRDTIKRNENTKKRREQRRKRRRKEEDGKNDGEEAAAAEAKEDKKKKEGEEEDVGPTDEDDGDKSKKKRRRKGESKSKSESDSKSKSRSRSRSRSRKSESSNDAVKDEDQNETRKQTTEDDHQQMDEGEVSSIASSIQSQTRTYFSLRQAIDEKFVPVSIKNLKGAANIVWLSILIISVVYFIIQLTLFNNIKFYIDIVNNSEKRSLEMIKINSKIYDISYINENYYDNSSLPLSRNDTINLYTKDFLTSAKLMKEAQNNMSLDIAGISEDQRKRINPDEVVMQYENVHGLPSFYTFNIWEAITQIVVASFQLAENPLNITHQNSQVNFINNNSMNSVMNALFESTNAIISESEKTRTNNIQVFLYLLLAVSTALLLSMVLLLPVIKRAKNNKQEVFELFTHKKVEKCIEEQLKKSRWFIQKYQAQAESQNYDGADLLDANIEEQTHIPNEEKMKQSDDKRDEYMKNYKKQKKKWKRVRTNFSGIVFKFLGVLCLIESFFLFNYFTSKEFLEQVSQLTRELQLLIQRQQHLSMQIIMQKEMFYSNNTAHFQFQPVQQSLEQSSLNQQLDYQQLLNTFSANYYFHSSLYNQEFNDLVYSNLCQKNTKNSTQCSQFNSGILTKGLYTAVVKYWTQLSQLHNDFLGGRRTLQDIKLLLNHQKLLVSNQMNEQYFESNHAHLVKILKADIDQFFIDESQQIRTVFIIFIIYTLFIYFFVWNIFIKSLMEELWKAKSVLSVLPVEVCFRIEEIRNFIYRNSSSFSSGGGGANN